MISRVLFGSGLVVLLGTDVYAAVDNNSTEDRTLLEDMFSRERITGQLRLGYIHSNPKLGGEPSNYSTALGGQLKYDSARYEGFNVGLALYTSYALSPLSGDKKDSKFNDELSTVDGHYDLLAEVYVDYLIDDFQIRIGRQVIDTPYMDSDDIRMTPNTFEGLTARYSYNELSIITGYMTRWQGPDAGIYEFVDLVEDGNGVAMVGVRYESDEIESSLWYYYADNMANIIYADAKYSYRLSDETTLTSGVQLAHQSEIDNSGIDATLFGAMAELGYRDFTLGLAYNRLIVDGNHEYFGGFGGGVGFVNMFEMTAGVFTSHQSATAWKLSIAYDLANIGLKHTAISYDYGHYRGTVEYETSEHNLMVTYEPSDDWNLEIVYDHIDDRERYVSLEHDAYGVDRVFARANYNF